MLMRDKANIMSENNYANLLYLFIRNPFLVFKFSNMFRNSVYIIFIFIALFSIPEHTSANTSSKKFDDSPDKPWNITADKISYDEKTDQYIASGNAIITKEDKRLTSNFIRFDYKNMNAVAIGNVLLTAGNDIMIGEKLEIDLNTETGTLYNGSLFVQENHFYISGDRIQKLGKNSYAAKKATISTCDGECPAWKITGRDLDVSLEGYGFIKHAALWVKKIPVVYTPFFVFPLKRKRQSGFLMPEFGDSDRKGAEYIQPYFWAINESSDATFYEHFMSRRGNKIGFEYRYVLDKESKGTLMYDFLNDKKIDDGTKNSSSEYGYEDDDFLRPNSDRYWFRMKLNHALPKDFNAKLDLDIVSDQDYLKEFKYGYTGYNQTDKYFDKNFGRDLDDYDDSVRENRLNINRIWSGYSLNAEARWYDNVINRRQDLPDNTLQKLPFVEFNSSKKQILNLPFYLTFNSQYTNFFSKDGSRGHRLDAHPRFYLPCRLKNYFNFEPSLGIRETVWYVDKYEDDSTETDKAFYRQIYDLKLDLSTDLFSTYGLNLKGIDRIKHNVRPRIIYEYIPEQNQDRFPLFDDLDRLKKTNLITCSITNTFTSRSKKERNKDEPLKYNYHQFCRFKLEQSYDINEKRENDPLEFKNQMTREPFYPLSGELDMALGRYFIIQSDAEWSHYDHNFSSYNIATSISDKRDDRLFLEYRFTRDLSKSFYSNLLVNITNSLVVYTEYERNIKEGKNIKTGIGLEYMAQCWSIGLGFIKEVDDSRFTFMVSL